MGGAGSKRGDGGGLNEQGEIDIDVTLRLKVAESEAQGMRPVVCCVCSIEGPDHIIICRGMCCPGQPGW